MMKSCNCEDRPCCGCAAEYKASLSESEWWDMMLDPWDNAHLLDDDYDPEQDGEWEQDD